MKHVKAFARRGGPALAAASALLALAVAACGVEVPDDVAADLATTTTVDPGPTSTEAPRSDDDLEQALIDNGYTLDEARCGAANLRDSLSSSDIDAVVRASSITDISPRLADDFAAAIDPCL